MNRKPCIMQTVRTTRLIANLPAGSVAIVTATGSGRFQIEPVGGSSRYWTEADALEPVLIR